MTGQGGYRLINARPSPFGRRVAIALIVAYFIIFNKFLGGTIWKQILRAKR